MVSSYGPECKEIEIEPTMEKAYQRVDEVPDASFRVGSPCTHGVVGVITSASDGGSQEV